MNKRKRTLALNTITSSVEEITPEQAAHYLTLNVNNRKTHNRSIRSYANDMMEGLWECNGESIIFDRKGKLRDGQNRMMAIVRANVTIVAVIVRGVNERAFDTMNQGRTRTVGTIFDLNPEIHVNGKILASTLKAVFKYYEHNCLKDTLDINFSPRFAEGLRIHYKTVEESVAYATNFKRPIVSQTLIGTLHYIFNGIDEIDAGIFLNAFLSGDCGEHKELLKLRNYFLDIRMNEKTKGMMKNRTFVGGVIIKAWNAWRDDRILRDFEYKKGEEFPTAR